MRVRGLVPLAAILLAACGGGDEAGGGEAQQEAAAGGGDEAAGMSSAAVASQAERLVQPRPGEYRTTVELIDFDMPGMPEALKQQVRSTMGASMSQSRDFCLTPEEAASNGPREVAENLAQSNCMIGRLDEAGKKV